MVEFIRGKYEQDRDEIEKYSRKVGWPMGLDYDLGRILWDFPLKNDEFLVWKTPVL